MTRKFKITLKNRAGSQTTIYVSGETWKEALEGARKSNGSLRCMKPIHAEEDIPEIRIGNLIADRLGVA